jgi:hypothetical protein
MGPAKFCQYGASLATFFLFCAQEAYASNSDWPNVAIGKAMVIKEYKKSPKSLREIPYAGCLDGDGEALSGITFYHPSENARFAIVMCQSVVPYSSVYSLVRSRKGTYEVEPVTFIVGNPEFGFKAQTGLEATTLDAKSGNISTTFLSDVCGRNDLGVDTLNYKYQSKHSGTYAGVYWLTSVTRSSGCFGSGPTHLVWRATKPFD